MPPERRSKVKTETEAVSSLLQDGCLLGVGGMHMHNNPMAVIREIVRQDKRIGRLITSPSANINADLLIGAGLVEEVYCCYIGFEHLGLAPNFRRFAEEGRIKVREVESGFIVNSLRAGAAGTSVAVLPPGPEFTDIPRLNREDYRVTSDPFTGEDVTCVPASRPDVSIIHCGLSDQYGNGYFPGALFTDLDMARASDRVILQCERVVQDGYFRERGLRPQLPGFMVDAVVETRYGCHPTSSHGNYPHDEEHLTLYLEMCAAGRFGEYLEEYVTGLTGHAEYTAAAGVEIMVSRLGREGL